MSLFLRHYLLSFFFLMSTWFLFIYFFIEVKTNMQYLLYWFQVYNMVSPQFYSSQCSWFIFLQWFSHPRDKSAFHLAGGSRGDTLKKLICLMTLPHLPVMPLSPNPCDKCECAKSELATVSLSHQQLYSPDRYYTSWRDLELCGRMSCQWIYIARLWGLYSIQQFLRSLAESLL